MNENWLNWDILDASDEDVDNEVIDPNNCNHSWILVGNGPVTGEPWYNCKKCDIKKEDYEKNN